MSVKLRIMPHQVPFVTDITHKYIGFTGGFRAGKSRAAVWKAVYLAGLHRGKEAVLMSPTYGMTKRNLLPIIRDVMPMTGLEYNRKEIHTNKAPDALQIKFGPYTSTIHLGLSAEHFDRLNGMSLAWGGLDEADKCNSMDQAWEAYSQLMTRLSDPYPGMQTQAFATSTPEGYGFMYKRFVTEPLSNMKLYRCSMRENFLLPPGYIDDQLEQIPASKHKAYIDGEFCNIFNSTVYPEFDRKLNHTDLTLADIPEHAPLHIGMDFNIDNMAAVLHGVTQQGPVAVLELVGLRDVPAMILAIKKVAGRRKVYVYPDASGKNRQVTGMDTAHALLRQAGFELKVNPANPSVGDRINCMNAMFLNAAGNRRYKVNTRLCPTYTDGLEQQAWVNGEPDKSKSFNKDHAIDAGGYFITFTYPLQGRPTVRQHG